MLPQWKQNLDRKPLLLRGARQVGKTHLIRDFGKENFDEIVEINFELQPELKKVFETLDPQKIIRDLSLFLNVSIQAPSSLLFLDEIQECPSAITALRYFYEKMPELAVIAAGSLLEFCLSDKTFRMPVGRVQYLYLQPFSFEEFLSALGEEPLRQSLKEISIENPLSEIIHEKLLKIFRDYCRIGGMPAVLKAYLADPHSKNYQDQQTLLLQTYRDDFGKYAKSRLQISNLQKVFLSAPRMVGQRYKFSEVDRESPSRDLKEALFLLTQAGVVHRVSAASSHGLPFQVNDNKFKIAFLDVGLMQRACGLDVDIALSEDFMAINAGAVAEQVVAQELIASADPHEERPLYFWARDKKNSQAEIDYLVTLGAKIIPIEVKAGSTGALRSLRIFMEENQSSRAVRFSAHPLSLHDKILSLPLYAIGQMNRLLKSFF
ncbi:MAG: ATP-binding protein [Deltaproteobacteria bacterium]|nr:ATP-binding protein [Deltaproteobacteria bacterium]